MLKDKNGLTEQEFLEQYNAGDYPRPSLTADIVIFTMGGRIKILMVKRGGHPYLGQWALPGGFVNPDESATTAAVRELEEETGIKDIPLMQLGTYSKPGRDPRTWVVTVAYMAIADINKVKPIAADDADEVRWFELITFKQIEENRFELAIKSNDITLSAILKKDELAETEAIENHGFAFDHAEIIADAVNKLIEVSAP